MSHLKILVPRAKIDKYKSLSNREEIKKNYNFTEN